MAAFKPGFASEVHEFDTPDAGHQKSAKTARIVESVRLALTALAPLWPSNFDLRPTIALVVCSAIVVVASALSLAVSKVPAVSLALSSS